MEIPRLGGYPYEPRTSEVNRRKRAERSAYRRWRRSQPRGARRRPPNRAAEGR